MSASDAEPQDRCEAWLAAYARGLAYSDASDQNRLRTAGSVLQWRHCATPASTSFFRPV